MLRESIEGRCTRTETPWQAYTDDMRYFYHVGPAILHAIRRIGIIFSAEKKKIYIGTHGSLALTQKGKIVFQETSGADPILVGSARKW